MIQYIDELPDMLVVRRRYDMWGIEEIPGISYTYKALMNNLILYISAVGVGIGELSAISS